MVYFKPKEHQSSVAVSSKTQDKGRRVVTIEIYSGGKWAAERLLGLSNLDIDTVMSTQYFGKSHCQKRLLAPNAFKL